MKDLTKNQLEVIQMLKDRGCHHIARTTQERWENGQTYYLDDLINTRGILRKFKKGNKEART
ncbi:MAG: hypothetical protein IAF02_19930 [Anaerolineae bacterium]|nr:hypothetical protein [Anaerolineae bacterium]